MVLTVNRRNHMNAVAELCYELAKDKYNMSEEDTRKAFYMGYVHDIGYRFCDNKSDHPEVGFRMLPNDELSQAIRYHGKNDALHNNSNNAYSLILNEADLRVNSKGERVTVKERLDDIARRYGVTHPSYIEVAKLAVMLELIKESDLLK